LPLLIGSGLRRMAEAILNPGDVIVGHQGEVKVTGVANNIDFGRALAEIDAMPKPSRFSVSVTD